MCNNVQYDTIQMEILAGFSRLLDPAVEVSTLDRFIKLAFDILLYGGDNVLRVSLLSVGEAEVVDDGHCFPQETKGEGLDLFSL